MANLFDDEDEEEESDEEVIDVDGEEVETETVEELQDEEDLPVPEQDNTLVKPVADPQEVVGVYDEFERMKEELIKDNDKQSIGSGKSKRTFITKSGWRKIATAFNVSVDIVEKEKSTDNGVLSWRVKARSVAPNGKTVESYGVCASNESNHMDLLSNPDEDTREREDVIKVDGKWRRLKELKEVNEHDILATAETRAKNRAISDLVGGGSVSAEEVSKESVLE